MKHLSRLQSIKRFCVQCMGGNAHLVKDCSAIHCKFFKYRYGKGGGSKGVLIRQYCLECVGSFNDITKCTDTTCALYAYRKPIHEPSGMPTDRPNEPFAGLESIKTGL